MCSTISSTAPPTKCMGHTNSYKWKFVRSTGGKHSHLPYDLAAVIIISFVRGPISGGTKWTLNICDWININRMKWDDSSEVVVDKTTCTVSLFFMKFWRRLHTGIRQILENWLHLEFDKFKSAFIFTVFAIFGQIVLTTIYLLQIQINVYKIFDVTKVFDDLYDRFRCSDIIVLVYVHCESEISFNNRQGFWFIKLTNIYLICFYINSPVNANN